jgi:hypothetical protein
LHSRPVQPLTHDRLGDEALVQKARRARDPALLRPSSGTPWASASYQRKPLVRGGGPSVVAAGADRPAVRGLLSTADTGLGLALACRAKRKPILGDPVQKPR